METKTDQANFGMGYREPREILSMIGQKSAIDHIVPDDAEDFFRIQTIDKEAENMNGEKMSLSELKEWAKGLRDWHIFAVRGTPRSVSDPSEIGELQGWIQSYYIYDYNVDIMKKEGMIPKDIPSEVGIYEVSYAKYPGAEPHQISAALRQALLTLAIEFEDKDKRKKASYKRPFLIRATVDPHNQESIRVLESSGFVQVGKMYYSNEPEDQKSKDLVYLLDWNRLYSILDEAVFSELGFDDRAKKIKQDRNNLKRDFITPVSR